MFLLGISILALVTFITETTLLHYIEISGIKPDLTLIVVIYCAFSYHKTRALPIGFIFGLIQDSLSHDIFGLHAILKSVVVITITIMKEKFLSENILVEYLLSLVAITFNCFLFVFLIQMFIWVNHGPLLWDKILIMIIYNTLAYPIVYFTIKRAKSICLTLIGRLHRYR